MMAIERQRKIVELVNERGSLRVAEISQMFEVTPETARRDLDILESEGKLLRSHGGAVRVDDERNDTPYVEREETNAREKMEIAKTALSFISAGDTIALDASSTAWFLARVIPDMLLTVLTNSIRVMQALGGKDKVQVISTGGILRHTSMSFVGPLALETLSKYHVGKAFLSCKGVHDEYGVSESNELQAAVKQGMVSIADEFILLADHSKFGVRDFTQVFAVSDLQVLITDSGADEDAVSMYREQGIRVHQGQSGPE